MSLRLLLATCHLPLFLTLLALSACGFEPVHGRKHQEQVSQAQLHGLEISTPRGIYGELLNAEIADGINPDYRDGPTRYRLVIAMQMQEISQFINPDGTAGRGVIRITSNYQLIRLATNEVVANGALHRSGSFDNIEQANYATYISREDATRRAVIDLSQDYRLRLFNLASRMQ